MLVAAGYSAEDSLRTGRRRAYVILTIALVVVAVPMVVNSLASLWARQVSNVTQQWLGSTPGAEVTDVAWQGDTVTVSVLGPAELPPLSELEDAVDGLFPWDPELQVVHTVGSRVEPE